MKKEFGFHLATNVKYGIGYSRKLNEFLKEKAFRKIAILVDEGVRLHSEYYQEIIGLLNVNHSEHVLRGTEEPDYDYLDEIAAKVRSQGEIDAIIGIGGGSTLDITKAVAILMTNPGKGIEYRGFDMVKNPGIPTIAIPTTAGTGSEVTINAVFTDKNEKKKLGINGNYLNATYAILDAEWTVSCPRSVAVSSGMDALVHALESYMCKQANPITRMFSSQAFELLYNNLTSLIEEPENLLRRQNLILASYFAGAALFNSGSGIAGALSYPIGVHYKVPHGIGGGIFIGSVVEFNVNNNYLDYAELLDRVELNPDCSRQEKSQRFAHVINDLSAKLQVPTTLNQWGITRDNVGQVAELMIPLQAAFDQNPIEFSAQSDTLAMLKKHTS